ncbi:hypothetical protein [Novosphingobium sp.]|uniref:hypothetical protein n=1 Tax=Novosphingobium sp. TaxID=1874826 RepID=UPI003D0A4552
MNHTVYRALHHRGWRAVATAGVALLAGAATIGADSPTGGERGVHAFVLSHIYFAGAPEAGACATMSARSTEAFRLTLPKPEQAAYAAPAQYGPLFEKMNKDLGFRRISLSGGNPGGNSAGRANVAKVPADYRHGERLTIARARQIAAMNGFPHDRGNPAFQSSVIAYDACTDPDDFPQLTKGYVPYDGKRAFGIDLDGKVGPADFTAPDGTRGVDNQVWHVLGCTKTFREQGDQATAKGVFLSARAPTLIEVRGTDNLHDAGDVTVNVYSALDPVTRDGRKGALAYASFRPDPDPALHATTHGRIVNGVLLSDPVDLVLNCKEQIIDSPRHLLRTRIRLVFQPDGSVEGGFYGYYTIASLYNSIEQMTLVGADVSGMSCPAIHRAITRYADGARDPRTGRFTAISTAMHFFGVPAFIVGNAGQPAS